MNKLKRIEEGLKDIMNAWMQRHVSYGQTWDCAEWMSAEYALKLLGEVEEEAEYLRRKYIERTSQADAMSDRLDKIREIVKLPDGTTEGSEDRGT